MSTSSSSYLFVLATFLAGCGSSGNPFTPDAGGTPDAVGPDAPPPICPAAGRYLELVQGRSWTYQVIDTTGASQGTSMKTQVVGPVEAVSGKPGVMAHRVTTTKSTGGTTISWQEDTGTSVIRHREHDQSGLNMTEELYVPSKLRLDEAAEHVVLGATWQVTYDEEVTVTSPPPMTTTTANKTETWTVLGVDVATDLLFGRYCALHLRRTAQINGPMPVPGSDKQYWFVRGIGKVRETGGDREELESFTQ